jgi:plastocyanin
MKNKLKLALSLVALAGFSATAGDLTGTVSFKGVAPTEKELTPIKDDPNCSALYPAALPTTHFYSVSASGGLADVIVSIKNAPKAAASSKPAVLDQKGCVYVPSILAVQAGQKVIVKNSDPCVHNVHTVPKENDMKNLVQMPGGADLEFVFDKPEPFLKFQCDVHPWMFAWVSVVDTSYFAVSDKDGKFTIKNVPAGKYTVEFAHRKLGTKTVEIEVKDSGAAQDFTFEPAK